jgi:hypothetical protein
MCKKESQDEALFYTRLRLSNGPIYPCVFFGSMAQCQSLYNEMFDFYHGSEGRKVVVLITTFGLAPDPSCALAIRVRLAEKGVPLNNSREKAEVFIFGYMYVYMCFL